MHENKTGASCLASTQVYTYLFLFWKHSRHHEKDQTAAPGISYGVFVAKRVP